MTQRKLGPRCYAQIIRLLADGDQTPAELCEETGLHYRTVVDYVNALHKERCIYVVAWSRDSKNRYAIRSFALGNEPDAKKPAAQVKAIKALAYRIRKHEARTFVALSSRAPSCPT